MKKKIQLFGALFAFLFFMGFVWPLLSFAMDETATAVAAAIPVPQTGIWFLDMIITVIPALSGVVVTLLAGGKVWAFLFSISKPITMFTSTQLPNPSNNGTIKMFNYVLLILNYISLNIFNDKNHDHPGVGAPLAAPALEPVSTIPTAKTV